MPPQRPDWPGLFREVCKRGNGKALEWGLPEQWVHSELFAELKGCSDSTGWTPFNTEIPYVTFCPVTLPRKRDWRKKGAVKWVDICLHSPSFQEWLWFELKVRHAGDPSRAEKAAKQARDAYKKDVAALVGFSQALTAAEWRQPGKDTIAYWMEDVLETKATDVAEGRHLFVSAFLLLRGRLDRFPDLWGEEPLRKEAKHWFEYRREQVRHHVEPHAMTIWRTSDLLGQHSLVLCEWE